MKILHVTPSYWPAIRYGGIITLIHGMCSSLAAKGHEVHVCTTNADGRGESAVPLEKPVVKDGVSIWYFRRVFPQRLFYAPGMKGFLAGKINEYDVVHIHTLFLWPQYYAARLAAARGVPYIVSPHGMLVRKLVEGKNKLVKYLWIYLVERRTFRNAGAVHFTTDIEKEAALAFGLDLPPCRVAPGGIDVRAESAYSRELLNPLVRGLIRTPYFLFLGRICKNKGVSLIVRALPAVPAARVIFAGPDENFWSRVEGEAEALGVRDRIEYAGILQKDDKTAALVNSTALLLPSYSENFANVVLEAMACGIPSIVTPGVGLSKVVADYNAGMVIQNDARAMAAAMHSMLTKSDERKAMGINAAKCASSLFSWDSAASGMEEIYKSAVRKDEKGRPSR